MSWVHTTSAQRIVFGSGSLAQLGELVRAVGARHLLLVTSEGRLASEDGDRVVKALGRSIGSTFTTTSAHVRAPLVQHALALVRHEGIDGVVSFGGGGCVDLAKAIAHFSELEAGTPGVTFLDRPIVPHIAIPTTYSGAQGSDWFSLVDERTGMSRVTGSPTVRPVGVVYDTALTAELPVAVAARTSATAIANGVESVWSRSKTPAAEALALAGVRHLAAGLPAVVDDPADDVARVELLTGAALVAQAAANAEAGLHRVLVRLLSARLGLATGLVDAALLPHSMRFNGDAAGPELARVGQALGDPDEPASAIERLFERVGLPTSFAALGVDDADLDIVARQSQQGGAAEANPRLVDEEDVRVLLYSAG